MFKNQKGQSLVEYLVLVSLVGIGSIAIVRTLSHTLYVRFANVTNALQNKSVDLQPEAVKNSDFKKRGLDDFFKNAAGSGEH